MISVTILTKNAGRHLFKVLQSVAFFDEVWILDNGSSDETLAIAKDFKNVRIETTAFIGFGPLHNLAASLATHDWILSIDSDEILSESLLKEILDLKLQNDTVYRMPRHTYYRNRLIKGCGWYPDRVVRLFNRAHTQFTDDLVHEKVRTDHCQLVDLNFPLIHYSYHDIADFLSKMNHYSELFAKKNEGIKRSNPLKALGHGAFAFIKSYFLKRGILDGYPGFLISSYQAHTAFYKYLKLYEKNQDLSAYKDAPSGPKSYQK